MRLRLRTTLEDLLSGAVSRLRLQSTFEQSAEAKPEHEVYLAGLWDPATFRSRALFTGSLLQCEGYLEANASRIAAGSRPGIRPTGRALRLSAAQSS